MGGDRAPGQVNTDIPADLADPHRFSLQPQRSQPDTQVVALMNTTAGALQSDILGAAEYIQGTDGGVAIARPGEGRGGGF